jgi:hypothetical protein
MKCHNVKELIPLAVGDDLRPRLGRAVRAHVDACPDCRKELEGTRLALAQVKAAAKAEGTPDWNEAEWKALMARFRPAASGTKRPFLLARPRWAAASVLGAFLCLVFLSLLLRDRIPGPRDVTPAEGPDVVSLTMISQETGLQVVWFFDKNFDWEGDNE